VDGAWSPSGSTREPFAKRAPKEMSTTTSNDRTDHVPLRPAGRVSLNELARRKGVRSVESMDDLVCDVFDTDDELDEFLTSTYAARRANLG
jgi:hypothetical protein